MSSYKDLIVWQKGMDLCELVYLYTERFPQTEKFGLTSQIRRCAVSIPSNIAEGQKRGSRKENIQFLRIAYGSGAELETQLLIALRIKYLCKKEFQALSEILDEIMRMLNGLLKKL